jgi:major capsid protein
MRVNPLIAELAERTGISFAGACDFLPRERYSPERKGPRGETAGWGEIIWNQSLLAMDAEPTLITSANAGIPSLFTTYIDPKLVEVLLTPNNGVKVYGERRLGDWIDETIGIPMIESVGEVTSYGDFNDGGGIQTANAQWEWRQPYLWQSFIEYGDREVERMARGRFDWVSRLRIATAINHDKFYNQSIFYGIANLANYGSLNDPALSAALTPTTKAATGTSWTKALAQEILADVQQAFAQLQIQTGSNLEMDDKMTLALHSVSEVYLANTNAYGLVSAKELILKAFPNIRFVQAPQFLSGTTYSFQLIVDEIQGQRTVEAAFNERMRGHRVVMATSSMRQKTTGGTIGAIIYRPVGIVITSGI